MAHPYQKKPARVDSPPGADSIKRPIGLLIAAVIECWTALLVSWRLPGAVKELEALFKGFGADLPAATKFALASEPLWYLVAAVGLAQLLWIVWRPRISRADDRRMKLSVRLYGVLLGLLIACTVFGVYAPIFKLGAVV
jgi:hypothetical protein